MTPMRTVSSGMTKHGLSHIDGVVIGRLVDIDDSGDALVDYDGNPVEEAIPSRLATQLRHEDIGCDVVLMFEWGKPMHPVIIGVIHSTLGSAVLKDSKPQVEAEDPVPVSSSNDEVLTLHAKKQIVLRCGQASITLTEAGKVILRGEYVLSRSAGVNSIKGASVQIN